MIDESLLTLFGVTFEDTNPGTSDEQSLDKLLDDLHILKCDYVVEEVNTNRFIFPSTLDVTENESAELGEAGFSVLKDFMHVGIVKKTTTAESVKHKLVLLVVKPSFVPASAYEDSDNNLRGIKKVRTMIFSVTDEVFNRIQFENVPYHDIIAAAAMSAQVKDWKFYEAKVMFSFYHMVTAPASQISQDVLKKIWRELPTTSLDSFWRQILFLCCGPNNIGHHVEDMLIRNAARLEKLIQNEDDELNLEKQTISEYKILYLLVEWSRFSGDLEPMLLTLKEINAATTTLEPSAILEKIKLQFASHVTNAKRHRCSQCSYQTHKKSDLTDHIRSHTGEKPFSCNVCSKSFAQSSALKQHKTSHRVVEPFSCNLCGQAFTRRPPLLYHLARHEEKGDIIHKCYACKAEFVDEEALKAHIPTHRNDLKFGCKLCKEKFSSRRELQLHNVIHEKIKPLKCRHCPKRFMEIKYLRSHLETHKAKIYRCDYCALTFTVNSTRLTHQFHKHEKDDLFHDREDLYRAAVQDKAEDLCQ